jgi:DNA-binding GntR family transcriptional regulator
MAKQKDSNPAPPVLHTGIYDMLRARMITGQIMPGADLSTRGLALELGVSQMPVRDALSRLAAEGAIAIRSKRRIEVPAMTPERFADLLDCRLLLEPAAARFALPHIDADRLDRLRAIDGALDTAIESGDVLGYMQANADFHFGIYGANRRPTLNRAIEALWLQSGPYMRVVYGAWGTTTLVDQHRVALDAITARDADGLATAIAADIRDGMGLVGRSGLAAAHGQGSQSKDDASAP